MPRDKDVKRVVRKRMAKSGERYTEARAAIRPAPVPRITTMRQNVPDAAGGDLLEVEMPVNGGVRLHVDTGLHLVVLKQRDGERWLAIWVGAAEANAIGVALMGMTLERPLTADLMAATIRALGGEVERIVIPRVEKNCYYAEVHVRHDRSPTTILDARASDALGVAVRTGAPIFVSSGVMDAAGATSETMPVGVTAEAVLVPAEAGAQARTIAYEPGVAPTHVLVDVETDQEVTRLSFPRGEFRPQPGTHMLLDVRTAQGERRYRVVSVESGASGLTRLRAELLPESKE